MNKTDKLKEAMQNYEEYGTDPDNIMMLTTDEWASAKDESLDNFDEEELSLKQMVEAIELLDEQISLIQIDIASTEELMQKYHHNYQMKYEYQKELNELNHELAKAQSNREKLFKEYQESRDNYHNSIARR